MKLIDENISVYYDNQMSLSKRINFEVKLINQKYFKEYCDKTLFNYHLISKSLSMSKIRQAIQHQFR